MKSSGSAAATTMASKATLKLCNCLPHLVSRDQGPSTTNRGEESVAKISLHLVHGHRVINDTKGPITGGGAPLARPPCTSEQALLHAGRRARPREQSADVWDGAEEMRDGSHAQRIRMRSSGPNQEPIARSVAAATVATSTLQTDVDRREHDVRAQNSGSSRQDDGNP
jgi:hypothetical protein